MRTMISPLQCLAETGVSVKVFMPLADNKLLMFDCKVFRLGKLARLHSGRLTQNYLTIDYKNRLTIPVLHMNVDRRMVVAVEEETKSVFCEHGRHWL